MEFLPGVLIYEFVSYGDPNSIVLLETVSKKMQSKLLKTLSGLHYILRDLKISEENPEFRICKSLIQNYVEEQEFLVMFKPGEVIWVNFKTQERKKIKLQQK